LSAACLVVGRESLARAVVEQSVEARARGVLDLGGNRLHLSASAHGVHHATAGVGDALLQLGLQVVVLHLRLNEVRSARAHLEVHAATAVLHGDSVEVLAVTVGLAAAVGLAKAGAGDLADLGLDGLGLARAVGLVLAEAVVSRLDSGGVHRLGRGVARGRQARRVATRRRCAAESGSALICGGLEDTDISALGHVDRALRGIAHSRS